MKVKLGIVITANKKDGSCVLMLTPAIFINRFCIFKEETAYCLVVHWLIFQVFIRINVPKARNESKPKQ